VDITGAQAATSRHSTAQKNAPKIPKEKKKKMTKLFLAAEEV